MDQRIGGPRVAGSPQLDENGDRRSGSLCFRPGYVDRLRVVIRGLHLAAGADALDFDDVAAVGPDPPAFQSREIGLVLDKG